MTQTVIEAEAAVAEAKAAIRQKQTEDAQKQLKELRVTAKQLRSELTEIAAVCAESDDAAGRLRHELSTIDGSISRLIAQSEDPLDDPDDNKADLTSLRAYRREVLQKLEAAQQRGVCRSEGVRIQNTLERLQYVARNLQNVIENGGQLGGPEGGIYGVR